MRVSDRTRPRTAWLFWRGNGQRSYECDDRPAETPHPGTVHSGVAMASGEAPSAGLELGVLFGVVFSVADVTFDLRRRHAVSPTLSTHIPLSLPLLGFYV